jgi:uncharacterized membrane protein
MESGAAVKTRLVFIDLLRGWAALVMIEVHVVKGTLETFLQTRCALQRRSALLCT